MASWIPTSAGNGTALNVDYYGRTGSGYGSDALDPDNPEIIGSDDMMLSPNHFGAGIHAYTLYGGVGAGWRWSGVVLQRTAGAFAGGQGAIAEVRLKKQFVAAALAEYSGGSAPLCSIVGMSIGAASAKIEFIARYIAGDWRFDVDWQRFSTGAGQTITGPVLTAGDLNLDSHRDIVLRVQCTSAHQTEFPVTPQDGSISLTMDGVSLINTTGIDPYINWVSGNPAVLNRWDKVSLGFAGLLGPTWLLSAADEFTPDGVIPTDYTDPCCETPSLGGGAIVSGPDDDVEILPAWTQSCDVDGGIPSSVAPSGGESWLL